MANVLLLLVLVALPNLVPADIPDSIADSLLALLAEEKALRAKLEDDVTALDQELADIKALRQDATCGCPLSMAPIAFSAVLTGTQIATFGVGQIIVFDKVDLNVGDGYDVRHGTFVAPVAGTYDFTAASLCAGGYHLGVEMVRNTEVVAKTHSGDSSYYTMGTIAVALKLDRGDEVFVRHGSISDSNKLNGESHTSFTGYLIDESIDM